MSRIPSLLAVVAMVAALVAGLAACGITADATPRDVALAEEPIDLRPSRSSVPPDDAASSGPTVWFVATPQGDDDKLQKVARKVAATPAELLRALLAGPTAEESEKGVSSAIPAGTQLLNVAPADFTGTLAVDLSKEFVNQQGPAVGKAVAQIVFTATEAPGVQRVVVTVDGEPRSWTLDNRSTEGAISRFDFASLNPTVYPESAEPPPTAPSTTAPPAGPSSSRP